MIAPVPPDATLILKLAASVGLPLNDERVDAVQPILAAQLSGPYPAEVLQDVEPVTHFEVDWP